MNYPLYAGLSVVVRHPDISDVRQIDNGQELVLAEYAPTQKLWWLRTTWGFVVSGETAETLRRCARPKYVHEDSDEPLAGSEFAA